MSAHPARALITAASFSALLLAGCARTIPVPTTVITPGMPNPEVALHESMQHVDAEMTELDQLSPGSPVTEAVIPEDLQRIVSFQWDGPLDKAVARIAASVGYTLYVTGPAAGPPLTVSVNIEGAPVYEVFRTLGDAAGSRATVQLDPQHHQVQVIHHA